MTESPLAKWSLALSLIGVAGTMMSEVPAGAFVARSAPCRNICFFSTNRRFQAVMTPEWPLITLLSGSVAVADT